MSTTTITKKKKEKKKKYNEIKSLRVLLSDHFTRKIRSSVANVLQKDITYSLTHSLTHSVTHSYLTNREKEKMKISQLVKQLNQ